MWRGTSDTLPLLTEWERVGVRVWYCDSMDFVVLSSSRGTTFQAVLDRIADSTLSARCAGLVSDREDRGCVAKARAAGLPVQIVTRAAGEGREEYDRRVDEAVMGMMGSDPHPPAPSPFALRLRSEQAGEGE